MQGQHYDFPQFKKSSSNEIPDDLHVTMYIYSEIQQHSKTQNEVQSKDTTSEQKDTITVSDQNLSQCSAGIITNATSIYDIILRNFYRYSYS